MITSHVVPRAAAQTVGSDREVGSDGIMQLSVIVPTVFIFAIVLPCKLSSARLFQILTHCMTPARDFLQFPTIVGIIEKRSIYHRSLLTALGSTPPQILLKQGLIDVQEFDFLLRFPVEPSRVSPVSFLSAHTWGAIKVQSKLFMLVI